jgi:type IV secretory pathway protease TraF
LLDQACASPRNVLADQLRKLATPWCESGEPLPSWQVCTSLNEGQVFLLGDTPGSWDGRYFGVTPSAEIVGQAAIVLAF